MGESQRARYRRERHEVSLAGSALSETLNVPVGRDGQFEFPMVLPGTYTARSVPTVVLAPTTPITVGATDIANVEVRIPVTKEISGRITVRGNVPVPRVIFTLANGGPRSISIRASFPMQLKRDGAHQRRNGRCV
jgi:hypothetical protein